MLQIAMNIIYYDGIYLLVDHSVLLQRLYMYGVQGIAFDRF